MLGKEDKPLSPNSDCRTYIEVTLLIHEMQVCGLCVIRKRGWRTNRLRVMR